MSADAVAWVYRHSPYKGATFSVHQAVADSVSDQGDHEFFMRQGKLATKARTSRPTANQALGQLVADGFLKDLGDDPHRAGLRRFRFLYPDVDIVYEARSGVRPADTSSRLSEQGVSAEATDPVSSANTGTQVEPKDDPKVNARALGDTGFDHFWDVYPPRNGRKIGKGDALAQWRKLGLEDRKAAWRGARNMGIDAAAGRALPPDAHRWLRKRTWEDWQTSPDPSSAVQRRGQQTLGEKTDIILRGTQLAADAGLIDDDEPRQEPLRELA